MGVVWPFVREKLVAIGAWPSKFEYAQTTNVPSLSDGFIQDIWGGTLDDHESSRREAFERIRSEIKFCIVETTPDWNGNLCAYLRFEVGDATEDISFTWKFDPGYDYLRYGKFVSRLIVWPLFRTLHGDVEMKKKLNILETMKKREEKLLKIAGRGKLEKQQLSSSMLAMKGPAQPAKRPRKI